MPKPAEILQQIDKLPANAQEKLLFRLIRRIWRVDPNLITLMHSLRLMEYPLIVSTPRVCGGAARLIRTRIPVWTLERMRQLGVSEADILRSYPTLSVADLVQVWCYAEGHRDEIQEAIQANERA